jgi:hypothetical protein
MRETQAVPVKRQTAAGDSTALRKRFPVGNFLLRALLGARNVPGVREG